MNFDLQSLMQMMPQVQEQMKKMQEDVAQKIAQQTVTAETGGGMVSLTMTGSLEVRSLKIAKEIIKPEDPEMLEDLIAAAINKAAKEAADMARQEMVKSAGLPNIPGLNL